MLRLMSWEVSNSSSYCLSCNASKQLTASLGSCVCLTGYYPSAGNCLLCSAVMTSCSACTSATVCTSCALPMALSGASCTCGPAYYFSGSACVLCSSAIIGCLACPNGGTCSTCNSGGNFIASGSSCICNTAYYASGASCLPCSIGCASCSSLFSCTVCNPLAFYILNNGGLC